tara:strand:- start:1735 stop:1926 length:192 start_codon:yes stop_codon:yes gene_type:complete
MCSLLFDIIFSDSLIAPTKTVYVVSDSHLEEIKPNQWQVNFNNLADFGTRLEHNYQTCIKVLE